MAAAMPVRVQQAAGTDVRHINFQSALYVFE
jgi:hypothetical protein